MRDGNIRVVNVHEPKGKAIWSQRWFRVWLATCLAWLGFAMWWLR